MVDRNRNPLAPAPGGIRYERGRRGNTRVPGRSQSPAAQQVYAQRDSATSGRQQALAEQRRNAAGLSETADMANARVNHSRQQRGNPLDDLFNSLFGDNDALAGSIGDSYDAQIAALMGLSGDLGGLTDQLIGGINDSSRSANKQIGGHFDYAAGQANAGRPVIAESGASAQGNVDAIYDTLATNLGNIPQQSVDQASAAAGGAIGSSVAGRVAAATAPFQAAGETSRANTKANLVQHTTAGQDYLSQLAAAAPSEAAMNQANVTGRANTAITEAQMALATQRAEIAAQTAALEGSKQRAILEATANTAGGAFDRVMQEAQLYNVLGADMGPLRDRFGMSAAQGSGDPRGDIALMMDQLDLEERLAGPQYGLEGFQNALKNHSPDVQQMANEIVSMVDRTGANPHEIINQLTRDGGTVEGMNDKWYNPIPFALRKPSNVRGGPTGNSLDDLWDSGSGTITGKTHFSTADPRALDELMRILYTG